MKDRPFLKQLIQTLVVVGLAILAQRFGVPIPPPQLPPITVTPPEVIVTPPVVSPTPPTPKPDPERAIYRIHFGRYYCTAVAIGAKRVDNTQLVLTAAHCIPEGSATGEMILSETTKLSLTVVGIDRKSDCAWCVCRTGEVQLPFAILAEETPKLGVRVWHAGYGVDKPGNREEGELTGGIESDGKIKFRLSVSSGDSGGPIIETATGRVLSVVCCTPSRDTTKTVWGCSPESANALLGSIRTDRVLLPQPMPERNHN